MSATAGWQDSAVAGRAQQATSLECRNTAQEVDDGESLAAVCCNNAQYGSQLIPLAAAASNDC